MSDIEFWLRNNILTLEESQFEVLDTKNYNGYNIHIYSDVKSLPYVCTHCDIFTLICKNLENLHGIPYAYDYDIPTIVLKSCNNLISYNFINKGIINLRIDRNRTVTMEKIFEFEQSIKHLELIQCSNDLLYDISNWSFIKSHIQLDIEAFKRFKNLSFLFSKNINKYLDSLNFNSDCLLYNVLGHVTNLLCIYPYTEEQIIFLNYTFSYYNKMREPCEHVMDFCISMMEYNDNVFGEDL